MPISRTHALAAMLLTSALVFSTVGAAHANEDPTPDQGGLLTPVAAIAPNFTTTNSNGTTTVTPIPSTVDFTRYAVTPGDQGSTDSCAAWAIGYTMMGWYANKLGYSNSAFAPMYLYSQTHLDSSDRGGGSYASANYNILETQGISPASGYTQGNYNFTTTPTAAQQSAAAPFKASTFHTLFASTNPEGGVGSDAQLVIQKALAAGYPVGMALPIYDGFYGLNSDDYTLNLGDPGAESNYAGGHYVTALGYDSEGVIIQNSWGTSWGRGGFAKLGWDFVNKHAVEAEYIEGVFKDIPSTKYKAPSNDLQLENTATGPSSLKLHWYAPSNTGTTKLSSYTLKIVGGSTNSTRNYATGAAGYSVTTSGLLPSTSYTYTMTATNTLGLANSATATFRTSATGSAITTTPTSARASTFDTGLEPDSSLSAPAPSAAPEPTPTATPTATPTIEPSVAPSVTPSATPTAEPSATPTVTPTVTPTIEPTIAPSVPPTVEPTVAPTVTPTVIPSAEPPVTPSATPTAEPTVAPTIQPTIEPTITPSVTPTVEPTVAPTIEPTIAPSVTPTVQPTVTPTIEPSVVPTVEPTIPAVTPTPNVPVVLPSAPPFVIAPQVPASIALVPEAPAIQTKPSEAVVAPSVPAVTPQPTPTNIVADPAATPAASAPSWTPKPAVKLSTKSVTLSWKKAIAKSGIVAKYSVKVMKGKKTVQNRTYSAKTTKVTVKKLQRHTKYKFVLTVTNSFGMKMSKTYTYKTR